MVNKLKKITTEKIINLPFQKVKFFQCSLFSIATAVACFYLATLSIPLISGTSILCLAIIYFIPTLAAYDLLSLYNEDENIPRLKNPKRILVLLINIFLGWTAAGWLVALAVAFNPGTVKVTSVRYIKR